MNKNDTILIVGQAKPGRGDAISTVHGEFYLVLILERSTGTILTAECNTILPATSQFVADLLTGKRLVEDMEIMERDILDRYYALTQKPLIACLKDAANRYLMITGKGNRNEKRTGGS